MHAQELFNADVLDLRSPLSFFRLGTTEEVLRELKRFHLEDFAPMVDLYVLPLSKGEWDDALRRNPTLTEFDPADQTLAIVALRDKCLLLTDDGDLFLESQALGIEVYRLPAFCVKLARDFDLPKRIVAQCLRYWESAGCYKKKDIKKWKAELQLNGG